MKKDRLTGKILKTKIGTEVRVMASDLPTAVMVEEVSDGMVLFFIEPRIAHGRIFSRSMFCYTVRKSEFFEKLDMIIREKRADEDDEEMLTSRLRGIYYRIPSQLIRLVVKAYINKKNR